MAMPERQTLCAGDLYNIRAQALFSDFEFACKMRVIWLEPLLDLDINFDHSSAPVIWLLSYCVLSDVPPHFSTPLHAITRSIHFLFLPWKLCLVSAPLSLSSHICIQFLLGDPSL
jgi:hypothetical protein